MAEEVTLNSGTAITGRNFLSYFSKANAFCCCSELFFSAMALHMEQGYLPLKVMLTASVKGTISEYSRIMFPQAKHWRTPHCPPQEKINATRTIRWVSRRMFVVSHNDFSKTRELNQSMQLEDKTRSVGAGLIGKTKSAFDPSGKGKCS